MNYKEYRPVMRRMVREKSLKDSDVALSVGALDVTESFTNGHPGTDVYHQHQQCRTSDVNVPSLPVTETCRATAS